MKTRIAYFAAALLGGGWASASSQAAEPIDFVKQIKPVLEMNCVACHREGHAKAGLRLDNRTGAMKGGDDGAVIVPGDPAKSLLYTSVTAAADDDKLMPPKSKGGPLAKDVTDLLRDWISQGASWPENLTLVPAKAEEVKAEDDREVITAIYNKIVTNLTITAAALMKPFTNMVPGSQVPYALVPIPSGEFVMGSPDSEAGRSADEGPQHKVKISPFWMGKCEVTWNEFELFMYPDQEKKVAAMINAEVYIDKTSDAVTRPTKPYVEMSFGMGKDGFPAISMTQHAANKYCEWLSAKTGHFYRLPTEAEWEYACRAGTTTAYSFGDDPAQLEQYAWFEKNSDSKYQKVGHKKPNPWGLYDMYGNVAEWCLDQYETNYNRFATGVIADPWVKATEPYPHAVRGGSWDDDPTKLRSAARRASDRSWKQQDPQLPKSIWYHTDAQFLGFRIVRPLKVPPPEELQKYWTSGVERD